jgi:hypothetical protein
MINLIKKKLQSFIGQSYLEEKNNKILKNLGIINSKLNKEKNFKTIQDYEFQVFSQFGDDGIIQFLLNNIEVYNNTFVEFGVENYEEANTRFLLECYNWKGLVIDSDLNNIQYIKEQNYYWRNQLSAVADFITKQNINQILQKNNFIGDIGILSIDIDGNDYWIWKEISIVNPAIVIIEYNARFGYEESLTIPYIENFDRKKRKESNIYYGASLAALTKLGKQKNYSLVYTNSNGNNAYFVKNELINENNNLIKENSPKECFNLNSFKEYKDSNNNIINLSKEEEYKFIKEYDLIKI